jgi:5-methylcytosine-specific restriction endonuclease McrA
MEEELARRFAAERADDGRKENDMSNPRKWRAKQRTTKPNSRQKRNGLFLDAHPTCHCGRPAREAHHDLPRGNSARYDWPNMQALCRPCHIHVHQQVTIVILPSAPII